MTLLTVLTIFAIVIERFVQWIKPIWGEASLGKLSVTAIVSMLLGIAICVPMKLSILALLPDFNVAMPIAVQYIMFVITGAATGGGASLLHDFWTKINTYNSGAK